MKAVTGSGIAGYLNTHQGINKVPRPRQQLVGTVVGYWTIIAQDTDKQASTGIKRVLVAKCRCGTIRAVLEQNIISGQSKSCGCLQREKAKERQKEIWRKIKQQG